MLRKPRKNPLVNSNPQKNKVTELRVKEVIKILITYKINKLEIKKIKN